LQQHLLRSAGCGSINLWPFGDPKPQELSRKPARTRPSTNANNERRLYVRYLD
jgi:hypothetical protein